MSAAAVEEESVILGWAKWYIANGFWILPLHSINADGVCSCRRTDCASPGKHPRVAQGLNDASTSLETIEQWFSMWPDANIGLATGQSEIIAIDIDVASGGPDSWAALKLELGLTSQQLDTVTACTGGGGEHLLFHAPSVPIGNSQGLLGNGIDVRGVQGYIVACPSNHKLGTTYRWEVNYGPNEHAMLPLPDALVERLKDGARKPAAGSGATGEAAEIVNSCWPFFLRV